MPVPAGNGVITSFRLILDSFSAKKKQADAQ